MSKEKFENGDVNGIAQAIDRISALTREAAKTTVLDVPGEPTGVFYLVGPDGKAERRVAAPTWRSESLLNPTQFQAFVKEQHDPARNDVVFLSPAAMQYCYDRDDRRDKAYCELVQTEAWEWLLMADKPAGGPKLGQVDFVRLLRITLRGCLPDNSLLQLVRRLKFNTGIEAGGDVQHGRESMGASIEAKISGQAAFPEELTLTVQPFEEFGHKVRIECALELFPAEASFRLTPYPLQLKAGMDAVLENLAGLFDGEDYPPCYLGVV